MQNAPFSNAALADFYRFAVLLTGGIKAGEKLLASTLAESEGELAQMRSDAHRCGWFATRIREKCPAPSGDTVSGPRLLRAEAELGEPLEVLEIEAYLVAQRFYQLPEPERSALALFYLNLFTPEEIAKLLKLEEAELSATLRRARVELHAQLRGAHA